MYRGNQYNLTAHPSNIGFSTSDNHLAINYGPYETTESSDYAISELIIFDELLSFSEIYCIENYLQRKYFANIDSIGCYWVPIERFTTLSCEGNCRSSPTQHPTSDPTISPTMPTYEPTSEPTHDPSADPTVDPTRDPTSDPTQDPTVDPTSDPTNDPTDDPTSNPTIDPTRNPTSDPTIDPTIDPTSNPSMDPTTDPTKDSSPSPTANPTGCSNKSLARTIISDRVYACPGVIESGGIYGSDAELLCDDGYHVCLGSNELQELGFTSSMCSNNVAINDDEFFATKETSNGLGQCYSVYGGDRTGRNDIWGCAKPGAVSSEYIYSEYACGVLEYSLGNGGNFNNWDMGNSNNWDDTEMEAVNAKLTDSSSGGVLCCVGDSTS